MESLPAKITKFDEEYSPLLVKVTGEAIHPMVVVHKEDLAEFQKRYYFEEELAKAAPTLKDGYWMLDHKQRIPFPSRITNSRWNAEKHAVEFEGLLAKEFAEQIRSGAIKAVSIELNWAVRGGGVKFVNGIAPFSFKLEGLSLLKDMEPGDPQAFVKLVEGVLDPIMENLILVPVRGLQGIDLSKVFTRWLDFPNRVVGFYTSDFNGNPILLWVTFDRSLWTQAQVDGWIQRHQAYFVNQPQPKPPEESKEPRTMVDLMAKRGWKA